MIRSGIACVALILLSGQSWAAELSIRELDPQPYDTDIAELFALGQGDLLLRTRGWREHKPARKNDGFNIEPWSTLYVLAPGGQVKERVELPHGIYQVIVPYGDGFAVQRLVTTNCAPRCSYGSGEPSQIVVYQRATDPQPKVVYETAGPFHSPRLYGAPDRQDLYVVEMGEKFRLTRINAGGQVAWQKTTGWMELSSIAATDNGLVFVQYAAEQSPNMVLRAVDREGQARWETSIPSNRGYETIYSHGFRYAALPEYSREAGFITLVTDPASQQDRDKRRLLNFHAPSGQLYSDVLVPQFAYATGTPQGLLLTGPMLGQSYVGMFERFGKFSWLRRYVADQKLSDIRRATTNARGDILFVTRERAAATTTPTTSVVVMDSLAEGLAAARGGCLDANWSQAVELASQLSMRGLSVQSPTPEELTNSTHDAQGCANREKQFIAFMQGLSAAMAAVPARQRSYGENISVRLTPAGEALRLESYSADRAGYPSSGVSLAFAAPYDRPAEFWKALATQVQPHLDTMEELDERFAATTHFRYFVSHRSEGKLADVLPALEKAARTVDERIAKIAPARLVAIRREGPQGYVVIVLRVDGFGAGTMLPLASADRTFLDIVEENRRAAARGQILIRD